MDKFKLEEISNKLKTLDGLLLALDVAIYQRFFDISNYEFAFAHVTNLAKEISAEVEQMFEESFSNVDVKEV